MSKKILLVEDEATLAMKEAQILKNHGYEVVTAYSGEKAIKIVNSDPKSPISWPVRARQMEIIWQDHLRSIYPGV